MNKFILKYLAYERKRLLLIWGVAFLYAVSVLILASLISDIIDLSMVKSSGEKLIQSAIILGMVYLATAFLNLIKGKLIINTKASIFQKLSQDTYEAMLKLPFQIWGDLSKEALYQMCIEDVKAINVISVEKVLEVFTYFVSAIGALICIGNLYWPFLVLLFVIYGGYFLPTHLIGKQHIRREQEARHTTYQLRKEFVEIFQRIRLVRINSMEKAEAEQFGARSREWGEAKYQLMQWYHLFKSIPRFLDAFAPALIFLIGGYLIPSGQVTVGELVGITVLLPRLNAPIRYYSTYSMEIREACAKLKEVYRIHEEAAKENEMDQKNKGNKKDGREMIVIHGIHSIAFDHVYVRLGGRVILRDFTYEIREGKKIGITGTTGAGKSTLFLVLTGLVGIESGAVYVNGFSLDKVDQDSLRQQLCVMQQAPYVFDRTLQGNILLYEDVEEKTIRRYTEELGLEKIASFRWAGSLGADGICLSGGQKQMIGVVRLLSSGKKWYLCDEITSAMDQEKRERLLEQLLREKAGMTVLFITHQIELLKEFDEILVLDDGGLAEQGTHEELLQKDGKYKELLRRYENR